MQTSGSGSGTAKVQMADRISKGRLGNKVKNGMVVLLSRVLDSAG